MDDGCPDSATLLHIYMLAYLLLSEILTHPQIILLIHSITHIQLLTHLLTITHLVLTLSDTHSPTHSLSQSLA